MPSSGARSKFAHSVSLVGKRALQLSLRAELGDRKVAELGGGKVVEMSGGMVDEERAGARVLVVARGEGRVSWGSK